MRQTIMRQSTALLLLTVFVLCNAPASVLHTLFADHKDQEISVLNEKPGDSLNTAGFNCKFAPHVVTTPFLATSSPVEIGAQTFLKKQLSCVIEPGIKKRFFHQSLRAPPVLEIV